MDACFVYIYQYEPYLRDPVTYPKVQVRGQVGGGGHGPAVVRDLLAPLMKVPKQHKSNWLKLKWNLLSCQKRTEGVFRYGWIQELKATLSPGSAFFACVPPPGGALVVYQRQPWVSPGSHSPYLAPSEETEP